MSLAFSASCSSSGGGPPAEALLEEARALHDRVLVLDSHVDIDPRLFTDSRNYTHELDAQVDLSKLRTGGVDVIWLIVYVPQGPLNEDGYAEAYRQAVAKFDAIHRLTTEIAPEEFSLAVTPGEARAIHAAGKKAVMIGIENGAPIGNELGRLQEFYDRGARYLSLTHNGHNHLADSHTGEEEGQWLHGGLSALGMAAIHEMNRLGIAIDVSHLSKEAMRDIVGITRAPIIASHSSVRSLCDHSRNLDDEQLRWIRESGGVVQAVAYRTYVHREKHEARASRLRELQQEEFDALGVPFYSIEQFDLLEREEQLIFLEALKKVDEATDRRSAELPPDVDVSDFVDHIEFLVQHMGIRHVGISSDFDGGGGVEGWDTAAESQNVTIELARRGYSEAEIRKLWGGNFLRVLGEVAALAERMGQTSSVPAMRLP